VLLGMESKLADLREVFHAIPTLAPGFDWQPDVERGEGVYKSAHPHVTFRSKKTVRPVVMAEATKEHPAQVNAITEDVSVARIVTSMWSGMLTPAQKSELLERTDKLLRAVKRARQRASSVEVVKQNMGRVLYDFLLGAS
jgi:hypothetical protein